MKKTYVIKRIIDKSSGLDKKTGFYGQILGKKCEISDIFINETAILCIPELEKTLRTSVVCEWKKTNDGLMELITLNTMYVLKEVFSNYKTLPPPPKPINVELRKENFWF